MTPTAAAIIPAAGSGNRMKSSLPKQYLYLAGKTLLIHTVGAFQKHAEVSLTVVVVSADRVISTEELLRQHGLAENTVVIAGGRRRQDSVKAGLDYLDGTTDIVLVHDGARPLVTASLISNCCQAAVEYGAAIAAIPVKDTLKKAKRDNSIDVTVDREGLWQAQTPQAARLDLLRQAFEAVGTEEVTDEASLLELAGIDVTLVHGSETNIKITHPEDLAIAEKIMQPIVNKPKVGHGYDAHRFAPQRDLLLGGVKIEYTMGLAGHSDADVVTHALCDAILGALGKGDIGKHFPDSSDEFKDIYSIELLERVVETMQADGYGLSNADITIICQSPKLAPHVEAMKKTLADACNIVGECLNIKATTTEKMGFTGRQEGISCHAVVFLAGLERYK